MCITNSRESAEGLLSKRGYIAVSLESSPICENGFVFAKLHYAYPECLKDRLGRHRHGTGEGPIRAPQRHSSQRIVDCPRHPHSEEDRPTTIGSFGKPIRRPRRACYSIINHKARLYSSFSFFFKRYRIGAREHHTRGRLVARGAGRASPYAEKCYPGGN
jgi:hypothetical protein